MRPVCLFLNLSVDLPLTCATNGPELTKSAALAPYQVPVTDWKNVTLFSLLLRCRAAVAARLERAHASLTKIHFILENR